MSYITKIKKQLTPIFKESDVEKSSVFGSVARGDDEQNSDVDILVKFKSEKSLFDLVRLKRKIEEILNKKIDLLTYNSIHPKLKKIIQRDEIQIYG